MLRESIRSRTVWGAIKQTARNGDIYKKNWKAGKKLPNGKFQRNARVFVTALRRDIWGFAGGLHAELLRLSFETESITYPIGCANAKNLFSSF